MLSINNVAVVLNNNPLATFLFNDGFLAASYDHFNGIKHIARNYTIARISFFVPHRYMIGVSVQGGLKPITSPYPP